MERYNHRQRRSGQESKTQDVQIMKTRSGDTNSKFRFYLIFAMLAEVLAPRASASWGDWWNWRGDGAEIKSQPANATVNPGANATFTVTASGSPAPTFQWLLQDIPIPGATNSSLTLTNVQPADSGAYSVRAQNSNGSDRSDPALLTVTVPPPPVRQRICVAWRNRGTHRRRFGQQQFRQHGSLRTTPSSQREEPPHGVVEMDRARLRTHDHQHRRQRL